MSLYKSISAVQIELLGALKKNTPVEYGGYKYQKLEDLLDILHPILSKNSLVIMQPLCNDGIKTIVRHTETGEEVAESYSMPFTYEQQFATKVGRGGIPETKPTGSSVMHQWGSAMTYGRRYGIVSIFGLQPDEDRGGNDVNATAVGRRNQFKRKLMSLPKHPSHESCTACGSDSWRIKDSGEVVCEPCSFKKIENAK